MSIADKLTTIAENEQKVFDAGKKAEYDAFWDKLQNNGNPCSYNNAFSGVSWTKERFKPKYKIVPNSSSNGAREMFAYFDSNTVLRENLASITYDMIDFSNARGVYGCFQNACFESVEVDIRGIKSLINLFTANNGGTIYKIKLKTDATTYSGCFNNATKLEELIFEDSIIGGALDIHWSTKLSKSSWISIINALSTTTSGLSITGSLASVKKAFETSEGANDGDTSAEWKTLTDTKKNWTISLV